jgi:hypothetical protein
MRCFTSEICGDCILTNQQLHDVSLSFYIPLVYDIGHPSSLKRVAEYAIRFDRSTPNPHLRLTEWLPMVRNHPREIVGVSDNGGDACKRTIIIGVPKSASLVDSAVAAVPGTVVTVLRGEHHTALTREAVGSVAAVAAHVQ